MTQPQQFGFGFDQMFEEQRTAHLPSTMEEAIPYYRGLIEKYNAAMLLRDLPAIEKIQQEAEDLAVKLNGGELLGIMGGPDAPVYVLERATAAPSGTVPTWGQTAGFSAHAVDYEKPFLSETGYRSFIGYRPDFEPGMTPDVLAQGMIRDYITGKCKGKKRNIQQTYVERENARRAEQPKQEQKL
jgi:hypothetical protein